MVSFSDDGRWRQLVSSFNELDADQEVNDCATTSDLAQSQWITEVLAAEPHENVYLRREDPRVGGYRFGPYKLVKSFQKQRLHGSKVQFKYHEAEMMDIDCVKPRLTLVPTLPVFRKREYSEWINDFYAKTTMFHQFSRIIFEKSDGDRMYSVYQSNGHVFQVVSMPPVRDVTDMVNDEMPAYGMKILSSVDQHGVAHREINKMAHYENVQLRVTFKKSKFAPRQFMAITTAF